VRHDEEPLYTTCGSVLWTHARVHDEPVHHIETVSVLAWGDVAQVVDGDLQCLGAAVGDVTRNVAIEWWEKWWDRRMKKAGSRVPQTGLIPWTY
jgi:hypothetical protein